MAYPQQTKIHGMLELLYRELEKAYEHGNSALEAHYYASGENVGVHIVADRGLITNAADALGVRGGEALNLFRYVCREGLVYLSPQSDLSRSFGFVTVETLSDPGLLEIGELPDPQQRFLMGLEAAIQAIQEDDRMPPETKQKGIDWLEEGKQVGRPLAVEVFKALFRGEFPMF